MSLNYKEEYIQSILSYVAYINMNGSKDGDLEWANLIDEDLRNSQMRFEFLDNYDEYISYKKKTPDEKKYLISSINFFMDNFKVIDQKVNRGIDGFSVTTYQVVNDIPGTNYKAGEVFVTYRGTEPGVADFWTDAQLALFNSPQTSSLANFISNFTNNKTQELQAIEHLKETIETYGDVYISGHSLGGYLAATTYYETRNETYTDENGEIKKYFDSIKAVSTFNGAGFSVLDGKLNSDIEDSLANKINNYFSMNGVSFTAGSNDLNNHGTVITTFQHLGPRNPIYNENMGMMDNHSMSLLVESMGVFAILEKLIIEIPRLIDSEGKVIEDPKAKLLYAINKIMMQANSEENDYEITLNNISKQIIELFNIDKSLLPYEKDLTNFISLSDYFDVNNDLKIKVTDAIDIKTNTDSNYNRALMYALLNNLGYQVIVPESFNNGIFDKTVETNELYNIANYSDKYLLDRVHFNQVYLYGLENNLTSNRNIPINKLYYNDSTTINGKFIFMEQESTASNRIEDNKIIYVNTDEDEARNLGLYYTYFKNANNKALIVEKDKAIVYDTPFDDKIEVYSNDATINLQKGNDTLYINYNARNVKVSTNETNGVVTILNYSRHEDSLILEIDNSLQNINLKKQGEYIIVKDNDQEYKIAGPLSIATSGLVIPNDIIKSMINIFEELFNSESGSNLILNESFLDNYINATRSKFGFINIESPKEKTDTGISQSHIDYIVAKLNQFKNEIDSSANIDTQIEYVESKLELIENPNNLHSSITETINFIDSSVYDMSIKKEVYEKLNLYNIQNYKNEADNELYKYYKQETKVLYFITTEDDEGNTKSEWKWTGELGYNRIENGVQVDYIYSGQPVRGELINYYNENLYITGYNVSGSNGSDVLIGTNVYGQSDYYGEYGDTIIEKAGQQQNGNDILIGDYVTAYSGNNYLEGKTEVNGGSGNDIIIAKGKNSTVFANHQYIDDKETSINENIILVDKGAVVFSSNGSNKIIDNAIKSLTSNEMSPPELKIYATGGDLIVGGYSDLYIIGSKEALDYAIENNLSTFAYGISKIELQKNFYQNYISSEKGNIIHGGYKKNYAILNNNDFIDLSKGSGEVYGLGNNEIIISDNTKFYSGGDSDIKVNGDNNKIHLGINDSYDLNNANYNDIYSRGYKTNEESFIVDDYYKITGISNKLYLGSSNYNLELNGAASEIYFMENSETGINNIIINEINNDIHDTIIDTNSKYIENLNITKMDKSNTTLNLKDSQLKNLNIDTYGQIFIESGWNTVIDNVTVKAQDGFEFYSQVKNFNAYVVGSLRLSLSNAESIIIKNYSNFHNDNFIMTDMFSSNLIEVDTSNRSYISYVNSNTLNITTNNETNLNYTNLSELYVNGTTKHILNIRDSGITNLRAKNSIINGDISNIKNFDIDGDLGQLKLTGHNSSGVDININGSIEYSWFYNVQSLKINQSISDIGDLFQTLEIYDSNFEDLSGLLNGNIRVSNSEISNIELIGKSYNLKLSNTAVRNLEMTSENISFINTSSTNKINSVKINVANKIIAGTYIKGLNIIQDDSSATGYLATIAKADILNISGQHEVKITEMVDQVYLSNNAKLTRGSYGIINKVNVDLDTYTKGFNLSLHTDTVINLTLESSNSVKITKMNGDYAFNGIMIMSTPTFLEINGKIYSKEYLDSFMNKFNYDSREFILLSENGLIDKFIASEDDAPEPTEPTEPYYENGTLMGTKGNDIIDLYAGKVHVIDGNGGEDTFNFIGNHTNNNYLNYIKDSGVVNIKSESSIWLTINLREFYANELIIKEEIDQENNKNLNIYYQNEKIISIENYINDTLYLNTKDEYLGNYEIEEIVNTINGTDNNDIIFGKTDQNSYIHAGKGNDIINLITGNDNVIYYNRDDGHETISSPDAKYNILLDNTINIEELSLIRNENNIVDIYLNESIILTLNDPDNGSIQFMSTYKSFSIIELESNLSTVETENQNIESYNMESAMDVMIEYMAQYDGTDDGSTNNKLTSEMYKYN